MRRGNLPATARLARLCGAAQTYLWPVWTAGVAGKGSKALWLSLQSLEIVGSHEGLPRTVSDDPVEPRPNPFPECVMTGVKCGSCGHELELSSPPPGPEVPCPRCRQPVRTGTGNQGAFTETGTRVLGPSKAPAHFAATPSPDRLDETLAPSGRQEMYAFLSPPKDGNELGWLGTYRVMALLGQGGMGLVFQAQDDSLQRSVALKVMRPEVARDESSRQRFLREARSMAALKSDHVVTIHQVGQDNEVPFLAMEYLKGEPLDRWLEKNGRPPLKDAVRIGIQIARGLASAHELGMIHRDIKPANIWLEEPGARVKILDFGLARAARDSSRLTQTGLIVGTPAYMAPEQAEGEDVDERCDLFSLGCVLYELLAGEQPFTGTSTVAILKAVALKEPPPLATFNPTVPQSLTDLVNALLVKEPRDRIGSAKEVVRILEAIYRDPDVDLGKSGFTRSMTMASRPAYEGRGKSKVPLVSIVSLVCVLAVAGLLVWQRFGGAGSEPSPTQRQVRASTAQGVTDDEIVLGMSAPFSGTSEKLGREMEAGIQTYLKYINEQGGINGRKVRLVALDDGYNADPALENVKKLDSEHKVFAYIGNVGTPTAMKTVPYAVDRKMLVFGPFTGAKKLLREEPSRYVFNYRAGYEEETAAIVKYLIEIKRVKADEIAVFAQADSYGDAGFLGVSKALRAHGRSAEQILRVGYDPKTQDVSEAVRTILDHKEIKAVVMVATYEPATEFIKEVKDGRPNMLFTNVSFVGSNALAERLGRLKSPKYAEGVIVTQVVPFPYGDSSLVLRYRERLARYFPQEKPGFVSLEGYIIAEILCDAIRRVGDDLTTDSLIAELEKTRNLDLGIGVPITFTPSDHQGSHRVWATQLDDKAKFQRLDLEQ